MSAMQMEFHTVLTEICYGLIQKEKRYQQVSEDHDYRYFQDDILAKSIQSLELFMLKYQILDENNLPFSPKNETDALINYFYYPLDEWPTIIHPKFQKLIAHIGETESLVDLSLDRTNYFTTTYCRELSMECLRYNENAMQSQLFHTLYSLSQEQYTYCRRKIIQNPVIHAFSKNEFKREMEKLKIPESTINSILNQSYESIPENVIGKCAFCGWTVVEAKNGMKFCSHQDCRKRTDDFSKVEKIDWLTEQRLNSGVMKFFALPGTHEIEIEMFCQSIGLAAELWPNKDAYDVKIIKDSDIFAVDVKAYRSPYSLYQHVESQKPFQRIDGDENCYIVIPDSLIKKKGYLEIVNQALQLTTIKCISMTELKQKLRGGK